MGTMDRDNVKRHHVWVDSSGGYRHPGLVITWRRSADGEWEAYVATTSKFGCALVTWGAGVESASGHRRPLGGTAPSDKIRGMAEVHPQWQQLFTAALKEHSVVGIRAIVMWHLGRPPTRSEMTAARYAGSRHGVRRPLPAATVSLLTPAGGRNVLIMARPDLSLSDWPKRPRCSPPPVTTLRTPLKLVFRKWPCRQTPTATVRGDRSHPRGGSSCRQGGGIRES
jgi:hypothetical protein